MGPPGSHSPVSGASKGGAGHWQTQLPLSADSQGLVLTWSGGQGYDQDRAGTGISSKGLLESTCHLLPLCCDTSVMMSSCPCGLVGISCSTDPIPCSKAPLSSSLSAKTTLSPCQNLSWRADSAYISFPLSPDMESYCKMYYLPHLPKQCVCGEDAGSVIQSSQSLFHLPGI